MLRALGLGLSVAAALVLLGTSVRESGGRKDCLRELQSFLVCLCIVDVSLLFWLPVSKSLCSFFFLAVADCEGFWSKEDGGLRDFLVLSVAGSGSGSGLHW